MEESIVSMGKMAAGVYGYFPEMGDRKPVAQLEARHCHYGNYYRVNTALELKSRGITLQKVYKHDELTSSGQYKDGWNLYKVTERAFDKLKKEYSISMECLL